MAKKKQEKVYDADSIEVLQDTEGVRKRFGMYIGSAGKQGVKKLFDEALGNAIDEFNAGRCTENTVVINEQESSFTIEDNGSGIPPTKIETICTKLHSGGKFEDAYSKYSLGMNGVGLTVINALSEKLEIVAKRDGYEWKQTFSKGKPTSKLIKGKATKKTGTSIYFIPDISVLQDTDLDMKSYFEFVVLSSYMNKGLTFNFTGIDEKGKTTINKKIYSENGFLDFIKTLDNKLLLKNCITMADKSSYDEIIKTKDKVTGKVTEKKTGRILDMEVEIFIQFSKNDTSIIRTFCNGLETISGGSHETGLKMGLTEVITKTAKAALTKKDSNIDILPEDIQEGLVGLVNVRHSDPVLIPQTKEKLNEPKVQFFVKKIIVEELTKWMKNNSAQAKLINERVIAAAKGRIASARAKTAKKKQSESLFSSLSSLTKVTLGTNKDPSKKRMFIVEGNSAAGSAIDARCTETDSIAKLRGKPLNTTELDAYRIEANKEWSDIIISLGTGIDKDFDISKLTHDMIIIMTDSDVDGLHIAMLLASFFFIHAREIVTEGHLYIAKAPLYKITENKKNIFFKTELDYTKSLVEKISKKYNVYRRIITKTKEEKYKKLTNSELVDFMFNGKKYKITLNNISKGTNAIDPKLTEFIVRNYTGNLPKLAKLINSSFDEINCSTSVINGSKLYKISGMYNYAYQLAVLDDEFIESLKPIDDFLTQNKYKKLYLEDKDDPDNKESIFTIDLYELLLKYATPKNRQRFKGLGEMDYDELWETTMKPDSGNIIQLKANNLDDLYTNFINHMGTDPTERKEFLKNFIMDPDEIDN